MRFFMNVPWCNWEVYHRAFRLRGGPVPAAILISISGVLIISECLPGFKLLAELWRGLLVFTGVIGTIAAISASRRSFNCVRRLGLCGWTRSRWWFAQSHLAFTLFAFAFFLLGFSFPASRIAILRLWVNAAYPAISGTFLASLCVFAFAALVGYAVSDISGRFPRSDAFACVHVAFLCLGGIALASIAILYWPPQRIWPDGVLVAVCGPVGLILLALFLILGPKVLDSLAR